MYVSEGVMTYPWSDFRCSVNRVTSIGPWICHNALRHIHGTTLILKGKNDTCLFFFCDPTHEHLAAMQFEQICVHTAYVDVQTCPPPSRAWVGVCCGMSVCPLFLCSSLMESFERLDIHYRTPF